VAVKLLMTWNILQGREEEYFKFLVEEFIPRLQQMGLVPEDAWYTIYGDYPQILTGIRAPSEAMLQRVFASDEWKALLQRLSEYVTDIQYKVVPHRDTFQL